MNAADTALNMARLALPTKRVHYSNEDMDTTQRIAYALTDADRAAGVVGAPRFGYSGANYAIAERAVQSWLRP